MITNRHKLMIYHAESDVSVCELKCKVDMRRTRDEYLFYYFFLQPCSKVRFAALNNSVS